MRVFMVCKGSERDGVFGLMLKIFAGFGWMRLAQLAAILIVLALVAKAAPVISAAEPGETLASNDLAYSSGENLAATEDIAPGTAAETTAEEDGEPDSDHDHPGGDHPEAEASATSGLYRNVDFSREAPVFYRPSGGSGAAVSDRAIASRTSSPERKVCQNVSSAPAGAKIIFPLTRDNFDTYSDTWGAARPQGGHEGTDLMVDGGTPLLAMTDATVVPVAGANANGWNTLGGYTVMLRAEYSIGPVKEGDLFYYAHMSGPTRLSIGERVEVGEVVGYAGDTGQGPEGTTGLFPNHLHLGWYDTESGRSQAASGAMNSYPLLEWVKANGGSIEGGSNIPYCEAPQSSAPVPSGGGTWQYPTDPGVRPDLDTGTQSPSPSPVVEDPAKNEEPEAVIFDPVPEDQKPARADETPDAVADDSVADDPAEDPKLARADETPSAVASRGDQGQKPDDGSSADTTDTTDPAKGDEVPDAGIPDTGIPDAGVAVGGSAGDAVEDEPEVRERPFRGFFKMDREEKIRFLLRLDRLGIDVSRFEDWLDRALEREEEREEPDARPESTTPEGTQEPACETTSENPTVEGCETPAPEDAFPAETANPDSPEAVTQPEDGISEDGISEEPATPDDTETEAEAEDETYPAPSEAPAATAGSESPAVVTQ